jgi:hypothetical protein
MTSFMNVCVVVSLMRSALAGGVAPSPCSRIVTLTSPDVLGLPDETRPWGCKWRGGGGFAIRRRVATVAAGCADVIPESGQYFAENHYITIS